MHLIPSKDVQLQGPMSILWGTMRFNQSTVSIAWGVFWNHLPCSWHRNCRMKCLISTRTLLVKMFKFAGHHRGFISPYFSWHLRPFLITHPIAETENPFFCNPKIKMLSRNVNPYNAHDYRNSFFLNFMKDDGKFEIQMFHALMNHASCIIKSTIIHRVSCLMHDTRQWQSTVQWNRDGESFCDDDTRWYSPVVGGAEVSSTREWPRKIGWRYCWWWVR